MQKKIYLLCFRRELYQTQPMLTIHIVYGETLGVLWEQFHFIFPLDFYSIENTVYFI